MNKLITFGLAAYLSLYQISFAKQPSYNTRVDETAILSVRQDYFLDRAGIKLPQTKLEKSIDYHLNKSTKLSKSAALEEKIIALNIFERIVHIKGHIAELSPESSPNEDSTTSEVKQYNKICKDLINQYKKAIKSKEDCNFCDFRRPQQPE